ncbi:MAG: hypothetical protein JXA33_19210 [Anaerolineae bacterium]|nr:hypothetical protein [Anaerolineae bacterium]
MAGAGGVAVVQQAQVDGRTHRARLGMQPTHIPYGGGVRTDTDQRACIGQLSPQQARKVSIGRYDFTKGQQVMPITRLGERWAEEEDILV